MSPLFLFPSDRYVILLRVPKLASVRQICANKEKVEIDYKLPIRSDDRKPDYWIEELRIHGIGTPVVSASDIADWKQKNAVLGICLAVVAVLVWLCCLFLVSPFYKRYDDLMFRSRRR
jgi:hypothetical protein